MKPVPMPAKDEENSITEIKDNIKKETEALIEESSSTAVEKKENGYLAVIKNVPFLCVMLANLPAVMGLYIPYMFLPGVSSFLWDDFNLAYLALILIKRFVVLSKRANH